MIDISPPLLITWNANLLNHKKILFYIHQLGIIKTGKERKIICVCKDVEKLEPTYIADRNVKYYSHHGIQFIGLLKEFNWITMW